MPLDLAWRTMRDGKVSAVPIVDDSGALCGMLSAGDIASYDMQTITQNRIDDLPLFNLLSVLEGTLVNELNCTVSEVSGELYIALPQNTRTRPSPTRTASSSAATSRTSSSAP